MADKDDSRELVLAPNEYAYILDKTSGIVFQYVGPKQESLAQTMSAVIFNAQSKTFDRCDLSKAIQKTTIAPEGWYVILKNPAKEAKSKHPATATRSPMPELDTGRKINIPGPVSFAPWPGQMAKIVQGHALRSNQYVLARVYDQTEARANWKDATIETADTGKEATKSSVLGDVKADQLKMGQLIVIKGVDVAFFIPPTGIEVVADQNGKLVRDAVTLETLDYCLLLDEGGKKRFEKGPAVIFPEPTEVFLTREVDGVETRRFSSFELSETSGIYIKVIEDYEEGGKQYKQGDELFVTGEQEGARIYFPRREHSIIKYDGHEIHYATAIPGGEGRYVLDRQTGEVTTVKGPKMYLPDPRKQVFARRILSDKLCALLYPNNNEALQFNRGLKQKADHEAYLTLADSAPIAAAAGAMYNAASTPGVYSSVSNSAVDRGLGGKVAKGFTGDAFERSGRYTEPRSVTLDTKYQGVVRTVLWGNYAISLVKNTGEMRVEVGPKTVLLDYDEEPQILRLSTGKPKNMDKVFETTFLMVTGNKVSDYVDVETSDFVKLQLKLSYRVNFEGDPKKWFNVENYVKLLCDHERSRLAAEAKRHGIETYYSNSIEFIREVVLGKKDGDKPRPGTVFQENGMRIYDVEVLEVKILNADIEKVLVADQRDAITQRLGLATRKRLLAHKIEDEEITRKLAQAEAETEFARLELSQKTIAASLEHDLAKIDAEAKAAAEEHHSHLADQRAESEITSIQIARAKEQAKADHEKEEQEQALVLAKLTADVEAVERKAKAITPDLIAALQAFGDKALIERVAQSMAPMALLGGTSVTEVLKDLLSGTKLANVITTIAQNGAGNGKTEKGSAATA